MCPIVLEESVEGISETGILKIDDFLNFRILQGIMGNAVILDFRRNTSRDPGTDKKNPGPNIQDFRSDLRADGCLVVFQF